MSQLDTVIIGGTDVTAANTFQADIGLTGGRIAALGQGLGGAETIDATGRLILPGGIEIHVHISQPSGPGIEMADDFDTATRAAAFGGNTTVMPFCLQQWGQTLREAGMLTLVRAENDDAIEWLRDRAESAGETTSVMRARTLPIPVEREATHRAISLVEIADVPVMIVHVSNRDAMAEIRRALQRGLRVKSETCPQYLVLTADDLQTAGLDGAKEVTSTPPRNNEGHVAYREGITTGDIDVFSSDHCPFRYADPAGKQHPDGLKSFGYILNGIPGIETRLPILFSEGVSKGRITLNDFVRLAATNHAKTYGLHPRKGAIAVGADADILPWDHEREETIRQEGVHHGSNYTHDDDLAVTGWPVMAMPHGRVVCRDGEMATEATGGHLALGRPAGYGT